MTAREHAEELRQEAIRTLIAERDAIDLQLKHLGYGQEKAAPTKRRGRPPKNQAEPQPSRSDMIQSASTSPQSGAASSTSHPIPHQPE